MLLALTVTFLVAIAFWRSVIQFLVALLLALLVLGSIEVARAIGAIGSAAPHASSHGNAVDNVGWQPGSWHPTVDDLHPE